MPLPLEGRTILVTRPKHQASELADPLRALGAEILFLPAIEIAPPLDFQPLDQALINLREFDWVVLTSANGVEAVRSRMQDLGIPKEHLMSRQIAVIGPATGAAMGAAFRAPDVTPDEYVSEAIAEAITEKLSDISGKSFLLLRADIARRDLATILSERGAKVHEVAAYRIVKPLDQGIELPDHAPDAILLTSSAAVRGTQNALRLRKREDWMGKAALGCIGPITAETVRDLGYHPAAIALEYTIPGLVAAITNYYESARGNHV
jgi:uroporphyrinogen-III synthase